MKMQSKIPDVLKLIDIQIVTKRFQFFAAILFLSVIVNNISADAQGIRSLKVKEGHPILFVTPEMVDEIRQKENDLVGFHNYVKSSREKSTSNPEDITLIRKEVDGKTLKGHIDYYINDCLNYGIDAYINDNALSKAYAKQYILSLLSRPITGDDDMPIRGKLFALGSLYDWMYDELDEQTKKDMRNEILDMVKYVDSHWHYISSANAGGHSRFGNISVLVALLPIFHDIESDNADRYFKYLQYVVNNWIRIFNPLQQWINGGGSHSMGWAYGASYSTIYPYMVWEFATDEASWLRDWQRDKAYFNLYGLRNDYNEGERNIGAYDNFPFWEDVWASEYSPNLQGLQVLFSAGYYSDKHAQWLYTHLKERNINGWMFNYNYWDILYNNFSGNDGESPDMLPYSRFFPHSAYVVMRDSWDFQKNTLMVFKSSAFYAAGHHHKDQNAFTIYYKGPLAIDAGTYEATGGWGSSHFWNYYTRTVAHNTMLIYKPNEDFNGYSNDGGQRFFYIDDPAYKDVIEGGNNHLDGIELFEENENYTYSMGDATKAYRSSKLALFTRSVVYLRKHSYDHPAIVVYDKVISKDASFKKSYLLHSIKEPVVEDNMVSISNDDGMDTNNIGVLHQETLLPVNAEIVKIGGRENDQEYYVADNGSGQPHNYNEEAAYDNPSARQSRELREGGEWRVEVSPSDTAQEDEFLHVLSVTDGEDAVETQYVASANIDGVIVSDNDGEESTLVLFCKNNDALNDTIEIPAGLQYKRILITGLEEHANYSIAGSDTSVIVKASETGTLQSSEAGTLYLDASYTSVLAYFNYKTDQCTREAQFSGHAINDSVTAWLWEFGDGHQSTEQNPVHRYDTAGNYTVTLVSAVGGTTDSCSEEITIAPAIDMPQVSGDEVCGGGIMTLTVTGSEGVYQWFDSHEGGELLGEGDTLITSELSVSKDYYVANVVSGTPLTLHGAKTDQGTGNYYKWEDAAAIWGLKFDAKTDIIIKSVKVFNGESENGSYSGERTFIVKNASGDEVASATVNVVEGEQRLDLNLSVPVGTGYLLLSDAHIGLWRTTEGAAYPYEIGDAVSITGGARYDGIPPVDPTAYYFFYDWEVEASGDRSSCRSVAHAKVIPLAKSQFSYMVYDTSVYFTNRSAGDSFTWSFDDGANSTEKHPVHEYAGYDTYYVKLFVENSCGADSTEEAVLVEKHTAVNVEFQRDEFQFTSFPNPANDIIWFHSNFEPGLREQVAVFNSQGKLVKMVEPDNLSSFQIDISDLTTGIYFMRISAIKGIPVKPVKFMVVR